MPAITVPAIATPPAISVSTVGRSSGRLNTAEAIAVRIIPRLRTFWKKGGVGATKRFINSMT